MSLISNADCLPRYLSKREISCLYWAAMGKTSRETAALLRIKPYTVEQYRKLLKKKFSCKTLAHAVYIGFKEGYLSCTEMNLEDEIKA